MSAKKVKATSCYFTPEEKRLIQEVAEREERPQAKVVQFAVRAFHQMYTKDRDGALRLASPCK